MGPIRLQNVEIIVLNDPISEVILAREVLYQFRFYINAHINQIQTEHGDLYFGNLSQPFYNTTSSEVPSHISRILLGATNSAASDHLFIDVHYPHEGVVHFGITFPWMRH